MFFTGSPGLIRKIDEGVKRIVNLGHEFNRKGDGFLIHRFHRLHGFLYSPEGWNEICRVEFPEARFDRIGITYNQVPKGGKNGRKKKDWIQSRHRHSAWKNGCDTITVLGLHDK
jgi:hypothetical protein